MAKLGRDCRRLLFSLRVEEIWITDSGKYFLVKSGILGFGIRNTAQRIWNPTKDWNPESKFYQQRPESRAKNPESKTVLDPLTWGDYSSVSVFSNTVTQKKVTRFLTHSVCQCDGGIVTARASGRKLKLARDNIVIRSNEVEEKLRS